MHERDTEPLQVGLKDSALNRGVFIQELLGVLKVLGAEHDQPIGPISGGSPGKEQAAVVEGTVQMIEMGSDLLNFILRGVVRKRFSNRLQKDDVVFDVNPSNDDPPCRFAGISIPIVARTEPFPSSMVCMFSMWKRTLFQASPGYSRHETSPSR